MAAVRRITTAPLGPDLAVPVQDRFLEDYPLGATLEYGYLEVSAREIIDFAMTYDPQPLHVDADGATRGPFGGLIASGFHTNALFMRLFADHYLSWVASLGSPGLDALSWPAPVRPGDELALRVNVLEVRPSTTKPDRGVLRSQVALRRRDGTVVMATTITNLLRRRPPAP